MTSTSSFSRREVGEAVHFDVTPARSSLGFVLLFAPMTLAGLLITTVIGAAVGGAFGAVVGFAVPAVFLWWRIWRNYLCSLAHRQPMTISVDPSGLRSGTQQFAAGDIVELNLHSGYEDPDTRPLATSPTVWVTDSPAFAAAHAATNIVSSAVLGATSSLRDGLFERQAARSFMLTIRCKQSNQSQVLTGGLTRDCAEALMNDIAAALRHCGRPITNERG
ncbi:MAG: hypothetical protein Q8K96_06925 [Rubrivivax sp.]|nr:hypothetical protein [Rubrivivax sp.]